MGNEMSVVILCGGQGTRAYPATRSIPKALMEVDGLPIVEHVMRIYASFGHREFILAAGYLKEQLKEYFAPARWPRGWTVHVVDTGDSTDTGGRLLRCRDLVSSTFHVTYCDGLGDINLDELVAFHHRHAGLATMTATRLRSQYGIVHSNENGRVVHFEEKPIIPDRWINAGFFVFERSLFDEWEGENLERDVLPNLAAQQRLYTFQHHGFWRSMDTYKDQQELNELWAPYADKLAAVTV